MLDSVIEQKKEVAEETTGKRIILQTTTRQMIDISDLFSAERTMTEYNIDKAEAKGKCLVAELAKKLEERLAVFEIENEECSSAEKIIIEIEREYSFTMLGVVVQDVVYRNFDKPAYVIGICRALLRYDYEEVVPWGTVLLPGFLNHRDERVKEYAVMLIDNWGNPALLPMLTNLEIHSSWLKDYIGYVIKGLQKTHSSCTTQALELDTIL